VRDSHTHTYAYTDFQSHTNTYGYAKVQCHTAGAPHASSTPESLIPGDQ